MKPKDKLKLLCIKARYRAAHLGIRNKTFLFFGIFTVCIIAILWVFQVVLLEDFYKMIKSQDVRSYAKSVCRAIKNNTVNDIEFKLYDKGVCVMIVDGEGIVQSHLKHNSDRTNCFYGEFSDKRRMELNSLAKSNGGSYSMHFYKEPIHSPITSKHEEMGIGLKGTENVVHVHRVNTGGNGELFVYAMSVLSPVKSAIRTLQMQMLYLLIMLSAVSALLSVILSKKISEPIASIARDTKALASGEYKHVKSKNGYREIDELDETLRQVAKELKKTEQLRRDLIANVSHDLRTPLTMITGYAEMMQDLPGESTPENLQIIVDESRRLQALVNDLLELSKIQSGTQTINKEIFSITETISGTITRLGKMTESKGYCIEFDYDDYVFVTADPLRISQVLYNLIINAVNYTGEDKTVRVVQRVDGKNVIISVRDSGKGIPAEKLENIWNRYYRVSQRGTRAVVGTGLGLSIVSSIMETHGGDYGVNSVVGQGSEFWISLPVCDDLDDDIA